MDLIVAVVFAAVYVCMILGRIPGLALDRTGAALLGAIALLIAGSVTTADAWQAVDTPTIALLLALMVVSAQFRLSGFYSYTVRRLASLDVTPVQLLGLLIAVAGLLSALLANDIVCLAMAPVLIEGCSRRRLDPKPFLLALACSANVGSAATLIGNPQNMLIGQVLGVPFGRYLLVAAVPALAGLAVTWMVVSRLTHGRWQRDTLIPPVEAPGHVPWQTAKGAVVLGAVVAAFLFSDLPREVAALGGAGVLLCSRRMRSREMLGLVDWQLIVLFISLFILNHAMQISGNLPLLQQAIVAHGIQIEQPAWLFGLSALLSNLVSNVPAVMFLLPSAVGPLAGPVLALSSTLAGNLFVVGSIANIIVLNQAAQSGVFITWREHARVGVPVTIVTLGLCALWLWLISA